MGPVRRENHLAQRGSPPVWTEDESPLPHLTVAPLVHLYRKPVVSDLHEENEGISPIQTELCIQ